MCTVIQYPCSVVRVCAYSLCISGTVIYFVSASTCFKIKEIFFSFNKRFGKKQRYEKKMNVNDTVRFTSTKNIESMEHRILCTPDLENAES